MKDKGYGPPAQKIAGECLMLRAEVGGRQAHRKLYLDRTRCISPSSVDFPRDGKQGEDKKPLVLRLVPVIWNTMVRKLVLPPSVLEHVFPKGGNLTLHQARYEWIPAREFYGFVAMIDCN